MLLNKQLKPQTKREVKLADGLYTRLIKPIHDRMDKRAEEIYEEMAEVIKEKEEEIMALEEELQEMIVEGRKDVQWQMQGLSPNQVNLLLYDTNIYWDESSSKNSFRQVLADIASRLP